MGNQIELIAHLMRRAGFGATRQELEAMETINYEDVVDHLVSIRGIDASSRYQFLRYHPGFWKPITSPGMGACTWLHDMVNTDNVLQEKMALFWHQVFATGQSKIDHWHEVTNQIDLLREMGMGNFQTLLVEIAKNPAMIYWLDNCDNHSYAVNENWGRELLELFSMGVGNYTEDDVRECSRAFTGWTMAPKIPRQGHGRHDWDFEYRESDHDNGIKTFLGQTGYFNGEDIIEIICKHPATANFIARHLYNFFVSDEPQVPAWSVTPPKDQKAVDFLAKTLVDSGMEIKPVLRALFLSDFFKDSKFAKIKSPAEVVVGTLRFVGGYEFPAPGIGNLSKEAGYMGQELLNPPSVEGWHTGPEWINSGSLMKRINFSADIIGDTNKPGIQDIISRLKDLGDLDPEQFVDLTLDLMGPMEVNESNRQQLVDHAKETGTLTWSTQDDVENATNRVGEMLQLVVSLREYQYA